MLFKNNLTDIADAYQYFIFDIWGVIHDGNETYPGVVEIITNLRSQNKKICFLSNAPRRAAKAAQVLEKFGITPNLYDFILTSGEAAYLDLEENQKNNYTTYGKNYLYIGPPKDLDLLDGLNYNMVEKAKDADFVINTGFDQDNSTLAEKQPQIDDAIAHQLPMICVNPDMIVVKKNGLEMLCAGVIANEYKRLGGKVKYYGKPYDRVYHIVHQRFHDKNNAMIAIGDALETDILGARNSGIASALVTGGILSNRLGITHGQTANQEKLEEICKEHGVYPDFVLPAIATY